MLDVFIFFGTILALVFFGIGKRLTSGWGIFIASVLFLVIGMGIFVSGWETQDKAPITITKISGNVQEITFGTTTFNPIIDGTPVEQIVNAIAIFYVGLGLILTFLALQETMKNRDAKIELE